MVLSAECIIFAFPNLTNPATDVRVRFIRFLCLVALVSLCACRVTKFVPDGSYLLDKVTIETVSTAWRGATRRGGTTAC